MNNDTIIRLEAINVVSNDELIINAMDSVQDGDMHRTKRAIIRLLASLPTSQPQQTSNLDLLRTLNEKGLIDMTIPFSSPDGFKVVYVTNPFDLGNVHYFLIDSDGNIEKKLEGPNND